jgi:hypothetical protein
VNLTNRHVQDVESLQAYIRNAVVNFNIHTRTGASVGSVRMLSDAFENKKDRRGGSPKHSR